MAEGFVNLVVKLELVKLTIPLVSNLELTFAVGNLNLFIAFIWLATQFINYVIVKTFYSWLLYVSIQFSISLQLGELPGARGI